MNEESYVHEVYVRLKLIGRLQSYQTYFIRIDIQAFALSHYKKVLVLEWYEQTRWLPFYDKETCIEQYNYKNLSSYSTTV